MEQHKQVGIWIRVSTEDQVRGESPETHLKRATAYAEAKGWEIIDIYRLEAVSGKAVMGHPETIRMLADIKRGRISGLVFSKLARLARNTRELLEMAEVFRAAGADLVSLQESIDTSSPAGRLFFTMIAAMAQWEREEIAERVAASVPIRAKMGKPIGGAAPFGYQWQDKQLVPHPDETLVRRLLHELFREHKRKKTVARILNERGYRTRNGSRFSDTTVARLVLDPTAKGLHRANYTRTEDRSKNWTLKPESEWVYTEVPPIVDVALWDECARILTEQRQKRKPPAKKVTHLFSGLAFCHCGTKMYVPSNSPKYTCQSCRNKIPVPDLDAIFHEELRGFIFSEQEVAKYLSEHHERLGAKQEALAALKREHARVQDEADRLYAAYVGGALDVPGFARLNEPLQSRLRALEDEQPRAEAALTAMQVGFLSQEEIIREARDLHARWPNLAPDEQRQIVEAIVERITIHPAEVEIDLYFSPEIDKPITGGGSTPSSSSSLIADQKATRLCGRMAFLPYWRVKLRAPKYLPYEREPCTLGEHLKKRRLIRNLLQREAAKEMGVCHSTYLQWEGDCTKPAIAFYPKIISFLGYEPWPAPRTLAKALLAERRRRGWSIRRAAESMQVDEGTFARWEAGERKPWGRWCSRVDAFLGEARSGM